MLDTIIGQACSCGMQELRWEERTQVEEGAVEDLGALAVVGGMDAVRVGGQQRELPVAAQGLRVGYDRVVPDMCAHPAHMSG